ncbi:MAG: type pilus modification protein PilV [Pseudomonadota bacterium]|jgi:type IV pilus assembly protein PilV
MNVKTSPSTTYRHSELGFSMIEVLVTMLIISLALMGTAGLQAYAMRLNQGGQFRTQAVFLASDIAERIESNPVAAASGDYVVTLINSADFLASTSQASTDCQDNPCNSAALAAFDLSDWQTAIAQTLPQSSWSIDRTVDALTSTYTITINWVDRQDNVTQASPDTGSSFGSTASGGEKFSYTATRTVSN